MEDIARPFVHCPLPKAPVLYSQNLRGPFFFFFFFFFEGKQRNMLLIWRHASCCKGRLLLLCQRSGYHTAVLWFALFLLKTLWKQNKKMDQLPLKQTGCLEKAEVKMSLRSYITRVWFDFTLTFTSHRGHMFFRGFLLFCPRRERFNSACVKDVGGKLGVRARFRGRQQVVYRKYLVRFLVLVLWHSVAEKPPR